MDHHIIKMLISKLVMPFIAYCGLLTMALAHPDHGDESQYWQLTCSYSTTESEHPIWYDDRFYHSGSVDGVCEKGVGVLEVTHNEVQTDGYTRSNLVNATTNRIEGVEADCHYTHVNYLGE